MSNHCLFCGCEIPEGRQICPECEKLLCEDEDVGPCGLLEDDEYE